MTLRILLLFFLLSGPLHAHDHNTASYDQLKEYFESTVEKFSTAFEEGRTAPEENLGWFLIKENGRTMRVPFGLSQMGRATADLVRDLGGASEYFCSKHLCDAEELKNKVRRGLLQLFGKKVIRVTSKVPRFFLNLPQKSLILLGKSNRIARRQGAAAFLVIAVSQVIWEGLESLVLQGAHIACTQFNAVLFGVVVSSKRLFKVTCSSGTKGTFFERWKMAWLSFKLKFLFASGLKQIFFERNGEVLGISKRNRVKMGGLAGFARLVAETPLFGATEISRFSSDSLQTDSVDSDLDLIFETERLDVLRHVVLHQHLSGIRFLLMLLETALVERKKSKEISFFTYQRGQDLLGRMNRVVDEYETALIVYSLNTQEESRQLELYRRFYSLITTQVRDIGAIFLGDSFHSKSLSGVTQDIKKLDRLLRLARKNQCMDFLGVPLKR